MCCALWITLYTRAWSLAFRGTYTCFYLLFEHGGDKLRIDLEEKSHNESVLIVAATPQFLERGVLWFTEHHAHIHQALREQKGIWPSSAIALETGQIIPPTVLRRRLTDLGYEKTSLIFSKGEYASRGNVIEVSPINSDLKYILEFYGNTIEHIFAQPIHGETKKIIRTDARPFRPGDYVVHVDHGIGIFRGYTTKELRAQSLELSNTEENFFIVEYAAPRKGAPPDTLYVPVSQKKKLDLYVGFETPPIHRLGGTVWFHTRAKAREEIEKFAKELLELYRVRNEVTAPIMHPEPDLESRFAELFPHEETGDQKQATEEILRDLQKARPMDRVLAGDVGFGKTEVALRAALRVITNGYSVLLLAPTTILAHEHLRSIRERFGALPIRVEALSRLTSRPNARRLMEEYERGALDLLIGTHRLLSAGIAETLAKRTGLLIIDEEQRFGVKQKERIKNLKPHVHVLSLSATPIPRTLSLALAGIRDLSVIRTPPPQRIPIQTFVLPYRASFVKDIIEKERGRNGQVFFLHNRIETLELFKTRIQKLVPEARIACIHGHSSPKNLVRILSDFRKGIVDVLIATTIIENGLDFPNANTLIVEDATRLGLAEAHQLRGRIGRGDRASYAYFFYPVRSLARARVPTELGQATSNGVYRSKTLTEKASLRLLALQETQDLGTGYDLALRDLEIRGAGNVLGREQSGTANKIGLNLYYQMLSDAIAHEKLKSDAL